MDSLLYNPTGMSFTNALPMKQVATLAQLSSLEDIYRYNTMASLGNFYPIRFLPSAYIETDSQWPIVMCPGTIVAIEEIFDKAHYTAADSTTGIGISGDLYVSISEKDGTALSANMELVYPRDMAGFITIANGGAATNDTYVADDGTYGIMTLSGEIASASYTFARPANVPVGIVSNRVFADMRFRYLNYEVEQKGQAIDLGGVLTLPYIMIYGSGVTGTVLAALRGAVNAKHQFVWVSAANAGAAELLIKRGSLLMPDIYGKFTSYDSVSAKQIIGKVLNRRNRVPYGLDEFIDSVPGSNMTGTDTGGLSARLYDFVKSAISATGIKPAGYAVSNANIKSLLHTAQVTATSNVSVLFGQVDVAFGTLV